ncbi:hypothetical protein K5D56_00975 [Pseudomonas cichorii]|uniref:Uncharacterized protein n=1 Tax=Pseudomonas cichorii TaxID=36746 RepID=A0ABQ1DHB6_PSECI|nr:hypothetical protein [Pseudomonas cichorii]MBX8587941.1 hypothetical protein [Pseudomonas cichorii]QVE19168.1 hypothetical protein KGD89_10735 [Pseudomonas cichorii]GFM90406.1 hypothetical protein PSCICP_03780 [Pseudomonas cichorii]SDN53353.1 hypothetical protein SAMN05216599_102279 [Pseudomonas cichorii]
MSAEANILGKVAELGGAAALVYLASFVYGFLEIQTYYTAFGLKWYTPFLPTSYFSMHSAATMSGIMLMSLAFGISIKIISSSLFDKVVSFIILTYLALIIMTTYVMRTKIYQLASEAMYLLNMILAPSTYVIGLGVAVIVVRYKDFLSNRFWGVIIVASTVMIFYSASSLKGEARAIEVMRNYGENLPLVDISKKKWSVLTVFEDKALVVYFPREPESHPIATIITIDKTPINFVSPGYVGDGYLKH